MNVNRTSTSTFNTQCQSVIDYLESSDANEKLHRHQIEAVNAVRAHFVNPNQRDPALVVMPTGTGKVLYSFIFRLVLLFLPRMF
jgi:type I site-specific restriction endonuclease